MTRTMLAMAAAAALILSPAAAHAQNANGGPKSPKVKTTQSAPKSAGGGAAKTHTTQTSTGPKTTKTPSAAKSPKTKTYGKAASTTTVASTKTKAAGSDRARTTASTSSGSTTLSPVQQKLQRNTNLAKKLEGRLPSGVNVIDAADGFRNLGQFVAAVNVSNNLDIPFADLKARMVDDGLSLGQAIQAERRDVDVTTAVRRAERDAEATIADADAAATSKTTAKTTKTTKAPKPAKQEGQR